MPVGAALFRGLVDDGVQVRVGVAVRGPDPNVEQCRLVITGFNVDLQPNSIAALVKHAFLHLLPPITISREVPLERPVLVTRCAGILRPIPACKDP